MTSRFVSRFSAVIAVLACLVFAFGVRDTAERPPPTPAPRNVVVSEFHSVLVVNVFAAAARVNTATAAVQAAVGGADAGVSATSPAPTPLSNAVVKLFWNDQGQFRPVGTARTDSEGRARLPSLPRGILWVLAEAEGRARSSTQLVMDEDERTTQLTLLPAHELEVTVLDEQDRPLEKVTLLVTANDPLPFGALTDGKGFAKIGRLGPAPYRVKAQARGYETVSVAGITSNTTLRLRRLGALLVRVEDPNHAPVAGAQVTLSGTTLWPARQVTTNAQGLANVRGLLAGSFDLRARKDNLVSPTELGVMLARGEERSITLRLAPGRFITVWVTDGDAEPAVAVPNADVVVAESGVAAFPERGRTQADGKVTLGPFEPGLLSASATARDFVGTSIVAVPQDLAGPLRVALRRGGTLKGRVVDVFDHAIDGASIEIIGTDFSGLPVAETPRMRELQALGFDRALAGPTALLPIGELGVTQGPIPTIPGARSEGGDYLLAAEELRQRFTLTGTPSEADNWVTRYDGTFAAHPVTPGRIRALVRHPAYVEGLSDLVTLTAGGVAEVKITLRAGGSLEGVVVDRYGRPIGGMRVELSANTGSRTVATYTADDGAFAFAALPSEVTITVARGESPDRPVVRERITVREGKRESVRIVVPEARDAVECLVVDERGDPIEGAEVVFASLDANSPLRQTRFTGADGRVTMDDTRGLELSVTVESPGYAPAQERFGKAPERVRVVLKHGVKITGRVTSVRGRVLVAQARVTVVSQGRRRVTTTNADGVWQMPDVPAGPIQLVVEGPSLPSVELERNVERQARLDRPFDLGDVDLPEAGGVSGVVVDGRGTPVPGARVSTQPLGSYAPLMAQSSGSVVTDASGNFRLAPVAIGKVTVYAIAEGVGQGRSEPVEIQRDRDRDGVKIQLLERVADEGAVPTGSSVAITLRAAAAGITTIASVAPGSEAERAGLRTGDELLAIDGVTPRDLADARQRLSGPENQDVLVEIQRQGQRFKVRTVREPVRR